MHSDAADVNVGNTRAGGEMDWEPKLTSDGLLLLSREGDTWCPVKDGELDKHAFTSTSSRNTTS